MALVIRTTGFEDYIGGDGGAFIKMLVLGAPGSGKTRSASFWPKPIYADCEKGRMSIADRKVPFAEVRSVGEMDELLRMLALECQKPLASRKYLTLVIDTVDSFQRTVIQERLRTEKKEALSGWADWGYLDAKMTQFIERLLNLQMNIIVNCHVKETAEGDDDSRLLVTGPKLKGDLRDQIAAEFDLVGYLGTFWEAEDGERVLKRAIRWQPSPNHPILKDRSGRLPNFTDVDFTEQDYGRIFYEIIGRDDFLDSLAPSEVLETLDVPNPAAPLGADIKGGQVATPADLSPVAGKKAPAKKAAAAKPVPGVIEVVDTPVPAVSPVSTVVNATGETTTPVDMPNVDEPAGLPTDVALTVDDEEAPAEATMTVDTETGEILTPDQVAEHLGGTVLSEVETADVPQTEVAQVPGYICGSQPPTFIGKHAAAEGCGTVIEDLNKMNIALLRTKTHLCPTCFDTWKAAN